jgi:hypothetical protein
MAPIGLRHVALYFFPWHGERGESHTDEEGGRNDEVDGVHDVDQVDSDGEWAVFRTVSSERQGVRLVYPSAISSHTESSSESNHLLRRQQKDEDGELEGRVRDDVDGEGRQKSVRFTRAVVSVDHHRGGR